MPVKVKVEGYNSEIGTIKKCPAFVDVMSAGFYLLLATDVRVRDSGFEWDWHSVESTIGPYPQAPIGDHRPEQLDGSPINDSDMRIVKFNNFWTIELDEGYSLLFMHPTCSPDAPFRTIVGIVDCDYYKDVFVQIPAIWVDSDFRGTLKKGTPIAQCLPVRRTASLDLEFGKISESYANDFRKTYKEIMENEGIYSRNFRQKK